MCPITDNTARISLDAAVLISFHSDDFGEIRPQSHFKVADMGQYLAYVVYSRHDQLVRNLTNLPTGVTKSDLFGFSVALSYSLSFLFL